MTYLTIIVFVNIRTALVNVCMYVCEKESAIKNIGIIIKMDYYGTNFIQCVFYPYSLRGYNGILRIT